LGSDVEIDRALQPFSRAGNLGESGRGGEQRACEHNPQSNAFHRTPPCLSVFWILCQNLSHEPGFFTNPDKKQTVSLRAYDEENR
jgi:hypothetical protein